MNTRGQKRQTERPTQQSEPEGGPNPECARCRGAGWLHPRNPDGTPDYSRVVPCSGPGCYGEALGNRYVSKTELARKGVVASTQSFDTFVSVPGSEAALAACKAFAESETKCNLLLVYGRTGCGKSHLATAVALRFAQRWTDARKLDVPDLLAEWRQSMQDNSLETKIAAIKNLPVLVFDDLKIDQSSDWAMGRLEEVISHRYERNLRTMVTTNADIQDLPARLASRFGDRDRSRQVLNEAPDYRRRKK